LGKHTEVASDHLQRKSVKELQALAGQQNLGFRYDVSRKKSLSRAAQLHLIDVLSRWSGAGLGAIAGITVYLAATVGQSLPLRAAVWASVVLMALYLSRRLRKEFRTGGKLTAHPFRWRANYTSSLAVLSAAFGAGAYLLTPVIGTGHDPALIYFLLLIATIFAAGFHSAHAFSAAAVAGPAIAFIIAGAWRSLNISLSLALLIGLSSLGLLIVYTAARSAHNAAKSQFPRSSFIRREALRPDKFDHANIPLTQTDDDTAVAG